MNDKRNENPDELWEMINQRDKIISELRGSEHWYDANSGRGDSYAYHCKCGYQRYDKKKLDSHIEWKLEQLKAGTIK